VAYKLGRAMWRNPRQNEWCSIFSCHFCTCGLTCSKSGKDILFLAWPVLRQFGRLDEPDCG
jgi:hypothetical protein